MRGGKKILQMQLFYVYAHIYVYVNLEGYIPLSKINQNRFHLSPRHRCLRPDLTPLLFMISQLPPQIFCPVSTQGKLWNLQESVNAEKAGEESAIGDMKI